ncbi:hypothetical protein [Winogradskyella endarachnes]|uniref:Uncharacterized protein n=1 Tax=Winogradskyella endarachnes TaxID=2681965 RepID=A0A6L6UB00_9FLAO|nr:hypothetical protein [Winogradskyella endarachnes]MUU79541.1 hypothetical protein [Winogradskyella endarachnes]
MKKLFYFLTILSLLFFTSCEDEDLNKLDVSSYTEGAVLTEVEIISTDIDKGDPAASEISVIVYFNDFNDNDTMDFVNVYVEFADTTPIDNEVITVDEMYLKTIDASEFIVDDSSGYPTSEITVTGEEALTALGIESSVLDGGDIIIVRYELVLTDGSIYSSDNVGVNVASTSHSTPFRYSGTVVCLAPSPLPSTLVGSWTIEGQDSYGDGWNGASIDITVDGTTTSYGMTSGSDIIHTVTIPDGSNEFSWEFVSGSWDSEVTFQIYAPSGNLVGDFGPSPTAGPIPINLCNDL